MSSDEILTRFDEIPFILSGRWGGDARADAIYGHAGGEELCGTCAAESRVPECHDVEGPCKQKYGVPGLYASFA